MTSPRGKSRSSRPPELSRPGQVPAIQHGLDVDPRAADEDRHGILGRGE